MLRVYYSLVPDADGARERQWVRSVGSLRRHNPEVEVALCLYGQPRPSTLHTAARAGVHVVHLGDFTSCFGDVPEHWRAALKAYPTLHKLPSLWAVGIDSGVSRLLYLDCDTYVAGDLTALAERHSSCEWYAREEPNSRRSQTPYLADYVDEDELRRLTQGEGLVTIPPYNTGVMLFDAAVARTLVSLLDELVWYAWRLLLGMCLWRPELVGRPRLADSVRSRASAGERRLAMPYPSGNGWIVEQVATWLTLGRIPGLTHDVLNRGDVAQGGESIEDNLEAVVTHYFSSSEDKFVAWLEKSA
jgi:hypothetical protein